MVTTEEVVQGAAKGTLSLSAGIVDATKKYGLSFGKGFTKLVGGSSNNLANQLVPGGINVNIGDNLVDAITKVSGEVLDTTSKILKYLKGKIHS